jgi:hypothetical protein
VRLIPAQYVKPFLKGHKNDYRDAEAIAEAKIAQEADHNGDGDEVSKVHDDLDKTEKALDGVIAKLGTPDGPTKPPIYPHSDDYPSVHTPMKAPEVTRHGRGDSYMTPQSFEEAVAREMAGHPVTKEVAMQRVINAYGSSLPRREPSLAKRETAEQLNDLADEIAARDGFTSRCEALRKARKEDLALFKRYQAVLRRCSHVAAHPARAGLDTGGQPKAEQTSCWCLQ